MGSSARVCSARPWLLEGCFVSEKSQSHAGASGPLSPLTALEMEIRVPTHSRAPVLGRALPNSAAAVVVMVSKAAGQRKPLLLIGT